MLDKSLTGLAEIRRMRPAAPVIRRLPRVVWCVLSVLSGVWLPQVLLAQEATGPAGAPEGGGANVVSTQSFPYGGLFVVVLLMSACLFSVCRSSRRN